MMRTGLGGDALGVHWMVDARDCPRDRVESLDLVRSVLCDLPAKIGMTRVSEPHVFHHPGDGGNATSAIGGMVVISESHISLHAVPATCAVHVDIFSCKPFDRARALDELKKAFAFTSHQETVVHRGQGVPSTSSIQGTV